MVGRGVLTTPRLIRLDYLNSPQFARISIRRDPSVVHFAFPTALASLSPNLQFAICNLKSGGSEPPRVAVRSARNWAVPQCGRESVLASRIVFPNPCILCDLSGFRAFPIR